MFPHLHSYLSHHSFLGWLTIFSCIWLAATREATRVATAPPALSTACGTLIAQLDVYNETEANTFVFASDAYECLISVPINIDVALRFIEYYNTTLQFQSTLSFLKEPPADYQQPAVDVQLRLQQLEHDLRTGAYANQYDFEVALQSLVYDFHDAHVILNAGILSAFKFGSVYDIMSISEDGKKMPELYLAQQIMDRQKSGEKPSPIKLINGEDAVTYLTRFAATNAFGKLEPHADWNDLMYNPVQDITGLQNTFGWQVPFYPGDRLDFTLKDNTIVQSRWVGIYQNWYKTGPLATGGDFYNYFVLGLLPASFNRTELRIDFDLSPAPEQQSWQNISSAFPPADIQQADLSLSGSGSLTGYFLPDNLTAVLSIPSFIQYGEDVVNFDNVVQKFVATAQSRGIERIVIDLQQNTGGISFLAFDTFRFFFPDIEPYAGSNRRSHPHGNVLGTALTDFWNNLTPDDEQFDYDSYHDFLASSEWNIATRLNAQTNQSFRNWQNYQGPIHVNGDDYTLIERYNLSDPAFDQSAFGFAEYASLHDHQNDFKSPFKAENIIILTDAMCSSSCALFVEMMTQQANVRSVVVGGAPREGPMQAVGGSRGASAYSADILNDDIEVARRFNTTIRSLLLPSQEGVGMVIPFAGFNLRSQMRNGDTIPLQFRYDAADCRIFFTLDNAYNLMRLWQDAAAAIWDDSSRCVAGSTGYTRRHNNGTEIKPPPKRPILEQFVPMTSSLLHPITFDGLSPNHGGLIDGDFDESFTPCSGTSCTKATCREGLPAEVSLAQKMCSVALLNQPCGNGMGYCSPDQRQFPGDSQGRTRTHSRGVCRPLKRQRFPGCKGVIY